MIPPSVLKYLPWGVLALGAIVFAAVLRAVLRGGARRRPVLLAAVVLAFVPAAYVGITWTGLVSESWVRFARPWATLVVAAGVAFTALRLLSLKAKQGPVRAVLSDLLATLAVLASGLAASGPELGRPLDRLAILVAVDRSRSIDLVPSAEQRIQQELTAAELSMQDDDLIGTIAFGATAATEDPLRPKAKLPAPQRVSIGRDGTDLAAAIRRALAEVPPDSAARIVLASDGVATRGDTMSAAAAAVAAEIPIDVLPLEQKPTADVRVVSVRAPSRADQGESMDLRLVTSSPSPADIEVRVRRDGELISKARAKIGAGEDVLRIREKAPEPGLHRYDVEITATDPRLDGAPEDNSGTAFVRVRGQAAALVVDGDGKTQFIARALRDAAFRVDEGTASGLPTDIGGLAVYDVVIFGDVPAPQLATTQVEALASYVRDLGGGLVLTGGDRSMGPGGYSKTPLEEVSPVSFDLKQEKRRGSLAEIIGIDISGSMGATVGGHTKLELANEAAARSAALLGAGDLLGVIHTDTAVKWTVPLGPITDAKKIDAAIRSVGVGGGGIVVDITIEAAYGALDREKVNLKHMLLFADGADASQGNVGRCPGLVADAFKNKKITTSVVSLGKGSDSAMLEQLSRLGGGRFYLVEDATRLPSVFAQETILASRSSIVEKEFRVAAGTGSSVMAGVDVDASPELRGYVVTIPKPRASVLLTGPEHDPILSIWSAGLGRSAAFTSDLKDRWGVKWTTWPGAARLVAQTARDVARKDDDARVRVEADASGGELHVRATVVGDDGRAQSFRRLVVHVAGPDGFAREVALEAAGAGAYAATVPLSRPGTYIAVARDELSGEAVGTTGAALTAGEELRPTGSDLALLGRIAELTGGKRRDTLAGIFRDRASRRFAYKDATPELIVFAALALLLAVAARRLAVPEALVALPSRVRRALTERRREEVGVGHRAEETVGALLQAKERRTGPAPVVVDAPPERPAERARAGDPARVPAAAAAPVQRVPAPHAAPQLSTPTPPRPPPPIAPGEEPPASQRPMTAAEILLARRRGKRS